MQKFLLTFYKKNIKNIEFKNYNDLYSYAKKKGILKEIKYNIKSIKSDVKLLIKNYIIHNKKLKSYLKFYNKIKSNKFKKNKNDIYKIIDDNFKNDKELMLYLKKNINKYYKQKK